MKTVSLVVVVAVVVAGLLMNVRGSSIVPALIIFGDSVVDAGNNNDLITVIKADFPPYGRDFVNHKPTGRFCNGKLATDFTAESLGFTSFPPAYLSQEARENNLSTGANFASAASGLYEATARLYNAIPLTQQLSYYREYQSKVTTLVGRAKANEIFSGGIHLLSAGSSDFVQNYYINPILNRFLTADQFSDVLMRSYSSFIQNLYELGARRIGVTSLPPIGCLPAAITLFGGNDACVQQLNQDAISYNDKLNITSQSLATKLSGLKLVVFDIFNPLLNMITNPTANGFLEARRACCGTGTLETAMLCNELSIGTCQNATQFIFWDGFHPTEAANKVLAGDLLAQGISLIS